MARATKYFSMRTGRPSRLGRSACGLILLGSLGTHCGQTTLDLRTGSAGSAGSAGAAGTGGAAAGSAGARPAAGRETMPGGESGVGGEPGGRSGVGGMAPTGGSGFCPPPQDLSQCSEATCARCGDTSCGECDGEFCSCKLETPGSCPSDKSCFVGRCLERCDPVGPPAQCPFGRTCFRLSSTDGVCVECTGPTDFCRAGYCNWGRCIDCQHDCECNRFGAPFPGTVCLDGHCGCREDKECRAGFTCRESDNTCVPAP